MTEPEAQSVLSSGSPPARLESVSRTEDSFTAGESFLKGVWWWLIPPILIYLGLEWLSPPLWLCEASLLVWTLLFCWSAHEIGHALSAYEEGDPTAQESGRLTLSPLAHLDFIGSVFTPVVCALFTAFSNLAVVLAWAKPIPVDVARLKEPRRSSLRVALAGPLMNLILLYLTVVAFVAAVLWHGVEGLDSQVLPIHWLEKPICSAAEPAWFVAFTILRWSLLVNALLVAVNLLPLPPFDGGWLVRGLVARRWRQRLERLQSWALGLLPILVVVGWSGLLLWPATFLWYGALYPVSLVTGLPMPELLP